MIYQYENEVLEFARKAHGEQKRKYTGEPYINHCIEVAEIVKTVDNFISSNKDSMIYAALLHDTLEDTNIGEEGLSTFLEGIVKQGLPIGKAMGIYSHVKGLSDVSKPEDGNRKKRKELDRIHLSEQSIDTKTIKLADIISNTKSIIEHDKDFARVYIPEKIELLKVLKEGDFNLYLRASYEVYKAKLELEYKIGVKI